MRREDRIALWISLAAIPVMFLIMPLTQRVSLMILASATQGLLWFLDCAAGSHLLGLPPLIAWALVGLILGGALGFWSVAPALGMRKARRAAVVVPLMLLAILWISDVGVSIVQAQNARKNAPPSAGPTVVRQAP